MSVIGKLRGGLLGGAVLWWVAAHAGPQTGTVTVHVVEPDVVVSVGGRTFVVGKDHYDPIVCELPAGEHRLAMAGGGTVLYAETFSLKRGEGRVLTAWRKPPEGDSTIDVEPVLGLHLGGPYLSLVGHGPLLYGPDRP